ncbi:hypothetical protein HMPREF9103_02825 [Lentilactobacillus parafarraginis F0439]|uniref:DUF3784 domain-containing protein n=2 Tax=Lentilactobacillus parafarraginis TaxID=390842 RepID=A0A0R1Z2T3_9LACO|nr:hypothetical protein [Lentilactobacillus parafarraginis]EHL95628.1 hypothetical protein HMPREF9103_02825 [Lentilactobacillus parafarraginis F0439]KRM45331.1 hypothetical protein FD47_GL001737 [Lentilactobacillus parafarraginis DSM 18390 = JCM 14109]
MKTLLINLLVAIAVIIAFFIAYYLLSHLHKTMFEIEVAKNARLSGAAKSGGIMFIILGLIGVLAMILGNMILVLVFLVGATFGGLILEFVILNIITHRHDS